MVFTPSQSENESDFHSDLSTSDQKNDVAFALAFTGLGIPLDCCLTCIEVLEFRKEIPSPTPRKYEALRFHLLWTREQKIKKTHLPSPKMFYDFDISPVWDSGTKLIYPLPHS